MLTGSGETENLSQKIVILGIGNILLSDEGIGVHVANELFKINCLKMFPLLKAAPTDSVF